MVVYRAEHDFKEIVFYFKTMVFFILEIWVSDIKKFTLK